MAYTYMDLTNEVLRSVNEVEFSDVSEFNAAVDFPQHVKDIVNMSIRDICNHHNNRWSFQREEGSQLLTVGDNRYPFDADVSHVDWKSFYIARDDALDLPNQRSLAWYHWALYCQGLRDQDANNAGETERYGKPILVTNPEENSNIEFILSPIPDAAYTVKWAQYVQPTEMTAATDVPIVPMRFKNVILLRAKHYIFEYREDMEQSARAERKYDDSLHAMRRILMPTPDAIYTW